MRTTIAVLVAALCAGCASERVVLLPSPDGHASKLEVVHGTGRTELAVPYAAVDVSGDRGRTRALSEADVERSYGGLLQALPPPPRAYVVYFETDSIDAIMPESIADFEAALADIASRSNVEVTIIGHTDRLGEAAYNDGLSRERAEKIASDLRVRLRSRGLANIDVDTAGRGEREPIVPTADEVSEKRNRRVEINVR